MPKKGGKKNNSSNTEKRTLLYKDDMQEYAKMTKMLGDRRIMVMLPDKTEVMAIIPGKFRKRCWMKNGDTLIVSRRDFQESKWDVCYKYNEDEVRLLIKKDEIPSFFVDNCNDSSVTNETVIEFVAEDNNITSEDEINFEDI
jgi:translation initiation factor 1A